MTKTRDITWLHCIYYGKPEARDEVVVFPQVALPFESDDAEEREHVTLNASEPKANLKTTRNNGVPYVQDWAEF